MHSAKGGNAKEEKVEEEEEGEEGGEGRGVGSVRVRER